jgi:hypothetical protein
VIQTNDIVYVLSGGTTNPDPENSLGGDPSSSPVLSGLNNLFNNVSQDDAQNGLTDYRCIYIFNNSLVETLWNSKIFTQGEISSGADSEVGFIFANEIQNLTVIGNVTGGTLTLSYEGNNFTFSYSSNLSTWVANFQSAIRSVATLEEVQISAQTSISVDLQTVTVFTILYTGTSGKRFHPILDVVANALTPSAIVSASRSIGGSPINSIATVIDHATTTPNGVVFSPATLEEPVVIGHLRSTDGFPVWIKRVTPPGTQPLAGDGFTIVVGGTAFP